MVGWGPAAPNDITQPGAVRGSLQPEQAATDPAARHSKAWSITPGDAPCHVVGDGDRVGSVTPLRLVASDRSGGPTVDHGDVVGAQVADALAAWRSDRDERRLRRTLLRIVAELE